jgi:hypothetical protein
MAPGLTYLLISARCLFMASMLTVGMTNAAGQKDSFYRDVAEMSQREQNCTFLDADHRASRED